MFSFEFLRAKMKRGRPKLIPSRMLDRCVLAYERSFISASARAAKPAGFKPANEASL